MLTNINQHGNRLFGLKTVNVYDSFEYNEVNGWNKSELQNLNYRKFRLHNEEL